MSAEQLPAFHGIYSILYALFDKSEQLDRDAMRRQVQLCHQAGVHGMAVLGLATEVKKLSVRERLSLISWTAEDNGGKVPLAVTVSGPSVAEQIMLVRHAESCGADWLILQPPDGGSISAGEAIDFHCAVAQAASLPVAIQNAPAFLGSGLSAEGIAELQKKCANFQLIKAEGSAVETADLISLTRGTLPVFNGRAGLEMTDNLAVGCRGLILAPDCIDYAVRAYGSFTAGRRAEAESIYRTIAPAVIFEMQNIETLICYGKRLFGARSGIPIIDRAPALRPTETGLRLVEKYAEGLGPMNSGRRAE